VQGNFLPHVDRYSIPYDTIPEYKTKSKMVYEFDAADVLRSYMYPAIARSFRGAGFQWATQFAYDPMALAYANTEYQTHYLNLAYTPSKAISMMIASEVFHKVPRLKNYGSYPADSLFDVFRVSYRDNLSEMNTEKKFYYSNNTQAKPVNINKLTALAGVGSSPAVRYNGSGAYFLDKIEDGVWRLEVMPDAIQLRDPFERASPKKEVTRIQWQSNSMQIMLPDLGPGFSIKGLNQGNSFSFTIASDSFQIQPGTYLLTKKGKNFTGTKNIGAIGLNEFEAPGSSFSEMALMHEPFVEVSADKAFTIRAKIAGIDTGRAFLQIGRFGGGGPGGGQRTIPMLRDKGTDYIAEVPASLVTPGLLTYRIMVQKGNEFAIFPGNYKGSPFAWDNYYNDSWKSFVAGDNTSLELYNPSTDRTARIYPGFRRGFQSSYVAGERTGQLLLRIASTELSGDHIIGMQYFLGDKLKGRITEAESFTKLMIRARTPEPNPVKIKVTLTNSDAVSFSTFITLNNLLQDIEISLNELKPDSILLLPRPYPGFMALKFKGDSPATTFTVAGLEKIEITVGTDIPTSEYNKPYNFEIGSIWLQKK
jgi:hypothetical protein